MLYQLGRNSNTHFFRYLLRHIEHDFTIKEKRAQREERRRFRRPTQHINGGEQSDPESIDEEDEFNVSVVGSENGHGGGTTSTSRRRHHHKIAMAYNA